MRLRLADPHRSRTAAGVLFLAMATTILQSIGPVTFRDATQASRFRSSRRATWVHPSRQCRYPSASSPTTAASLAKIRSADREARNADKRGPTAQSAPCAVPSASRGGGELYSCRHRSNRQRRKPDIKSRCSPRTPNRASSKNPPLVLQPDFEEERCVRQALQPRRSPALSDKHRIGREAHRAEKEEGPFKPGRNKSAAHVVGVIGIPVITRTDGDDRLECRRTARCNLQSIEAAPGDTHHPGDAAAPGLRRQPRYHLHAIGQLLL